MPLTNVCKQRRKPIQLTCQRFPEDLFLAVENQAGEVSGVVGYFPEQPGQMLLRSGIYKQSANQIEKVIPGGAINRPVGGQAFASPENFSATIQVSGQLCRRR